MYSTLYNNIYNILYLFEIFMKKGSINQSNYLID